MRGLIVVGEPNLEELKLKYQLTRIFQVGRCEVPLSDEHLEWSEFFWFVGRSRREDGFLVDGRLNRREIRYCLKLLESKEGGLLCFYGESLLIYPSTILSRCWREYSKDLKREYSNLHRFLSLLQYCDKPLLRYFFFVYDYSKQTASEDWELWYLWLKKDERFFTKEQLGLAPSLRENAEFINSLPYRLRKLLPLAMFIVSARR